MRRRTQVASTGAEGWRHSSRCDLRRSGACRNRDLTRHRAGRQKIAHRPSDWLVPRRNWHGVRLYRLGPISLSQLSLQHFPDGVARQALHDFDSHETLSLAEPLVGPRANALGALRTSGSEYYKRHRRLAPLRMPPHTRGWSMRKSLPYGPGPVPLAAGFIELSVRHDRFVQDQCRMTWAALRMNAYEIGDHTKLRAQGCSDRHSRRSIEDVNVERIQSAGCVVREAAEFQPRAHMWFMLVPCP